MTDDATAKRLQTQRILAWKLAHAADGRARVRDFLVHVTKNQELPSLDVEPVELWNNALSKVVARALEAEAAEALRRPPGPWVRLPESENALIDAWVAECRAERARSAASISESPASATATAPSSLKYVFVPLANAERWVAVDLEKDESLSISIEQNKDDGMVSATVGAETFAFSEPTFYGEKQWRNVIIDASSLRVEWLRERAVAVRRHVGVPVPQSPPDCTISCVLAAEPRVAVVVALMTVALVVLPLLVGASLLESLNEYAVFSGAWALLGAGVTGLGVSRRFKVAALRSLARRLPHTVAAAAIACLALVAIRFAFIVVFNSTYDAIKIGERTLVSYPTELIGSWSEKGLADSIAHAAGGPWELSSAFVQPPCAHAIDRSFIHGLFSQHRVASQSRRFRVVRDPELARLGLIAEGLSPANGGGRCVDFAPPSPPAAIVGVALPAGYRALPIGSRTPLPNGVAMLRAIAREGRDEPGAPSGLVSVGLTGEGAAEIASWSVVVEDRDDPRCEAAGDQVDCAHLGSGEHRGWSTFIVTADRRPSELRVPTFGGRARSAIARVAGVRGERAEAFVVDRDTSELWIASSANRENRVALRGRAPMREWSMVPRVGTDASLDLSVTLAQSPGDASASVEIAVPPWPATLEVRHGQTLLGTASLSSETNVILVRLAREALLSDGDQLVAGVGGRVLWTNRAGGVRDYGLVPRAADQSVELMRLALRHGSVDRELCLQSGRWTRCSSGRAQIAEACCRTGDGPWRGCSLADALRRGCTRPRLIPLEAPAICPPQQFFQCD